MSQCKGCGREIVWGEDVINGSTIPLDPKAPVYSVLKQNGKVLLQRQHDCMVSHFATCANASDFSGKNRKSNVA